MRKLLFMICLAGAVIAGKSQNISDYPLYPIPEKYRLKGGAGLPYKVDNSQKKYFPPVVDQGGTWSCNQAGSIGYVLTYEINRLRNLAADTPENLYNPGFAFNFLNSSDGGVGVSYFDSWEIVKAAGCANDVDYTYYRMGAGIWMSGYGKYYRAMQNRISVNYSLPVGTPEDLALFKQYLYNHFEDSPDGGIGNIQIASSGIANSYWTDPETGEQWPVIYTFGTDIGHCFTFAGYNDSVRVDLNQDGKFTNDIDITNDGKVDMNDWEIGALLAFNSWGEGWSKGGKSYVLYSVVARDGNNGGIWNRSVHVIKALKNYQPELTMRVVMRHQQKKRFSILAGFSRDLTATGPEQTLSFPIFNHQGNNTPLEDPENQNDKERFEFGLDITPFISSLEPGVPVKFFLIVEENDPGDLASGQIDEFSVIDYLKGKREVISDQKSVPVVNNGFTYVSLTESLDFSKLKVEDPAVTNITIGQPFYAQLSASGGQPPYRWELVNDYKEKVSISSFESISGDTLSDYADKKQFRRVTLPFEFPFYGVKYTSLIADIKGVLYFGNEYISYPYAINQDLIFRVRKSIVPFGAEIQINAPGDALIFSATDSVATFEWKASVKQGSFVYPLEVIARLYPDGRIVFQYGRRSQPADSDYPWQAGISNGDQSLYKYASVNQSRQIIENDQITFTPSDYPANLAITDDGILSGLASEEDHLWNIYVKVTDSYNQVRDAAIPISTIIKDTSSVESRNYPNPFRRTTGISFKIVEEMPVTLEVYDFAGNRVMELLNKTLQPGEFTYYWNARDASNRDVNPGTYIYRLRTSTHTETGKMVLVR